MEISFYHYNKCKKSRAALEYLKVSGIKPVIVHYVEEGIDKEKLRELFNLLRVKPSDMVRKHESLYEEDLRNKEISEEEWLIILAENPKLIRRPIITYGPNASIGDPPQNANQILNAYKQDHENKN